MTRIETPFSPEAIVVAPVEDQSPVVLFDDEAQRIRRRVAARLSVLGYEVVPFEELERIEAAAASGRLVLEGDRKCRAPLSRREVAARYFADAPTADTTTSCADDCFLQVLLANLKPTDTSVALISREVHRSHDPAAWVKAADSVADRGGTFGLIGLGGFGSSHPPPIMFGTPEPFGPWAKAPDGTEFNAIQADVNTCAHPDVHTGFTWWLRVAVATTGRVSRCSAVSDHTQARPSDAECLCGFVETVKYPRGKAFRRYRVQAIDDGGFRPDDRSFRLVQAGTEVWVARLTEAPALSVCETRGAPPTTPGTRVEVDVLPDGAIAGVRVHGDITTTQSIAWAQCITEELPKIALPCSPPGIDTLHLGFGPA